ncbi:uncharacterized protein B0J16DRAFT_349210 [Fusarium flagelliforme]|uniref:uncharacterized protein n=1 Tax=Fusarium flagelliforme TaxID=2675880 RepID=UPI001E8EEB60|nr:uncharacterized protein B0J16DRAFT_349210 [Fusarium flagelliforme]KAH7174806.1 hypothetical protein B0J16DRAFT_349210 [Fusarium flagelliforme]
MASEDFRPDLIDLISSYSILTSLSPWLSTIDLHNLGLTSRSAYAYIHSPKIFSYLTRRSLCDGHGLLQRQAYAGPYCSLSKLPGSKLPGALTYSPHGQGDEEIEVQLYNVKCAEADVLPCLKCGVNICEECRCYPRAAPAISKPNRRPHIMGSLQYSNIMCLCDTCDEEMENQVKGKFLNERCDCDRYTRWICVKCEGEEREETREYVEERTEMEWEWMQYGVDYGDDSEPSKTLNDHAFIRAVGTSAPSRQKCANSG